MKKWNFEQWYANKSLEWKKAGIFPCKNGVWREKMEMKTSQVMASDCTRARDKRAWLESVKINNVFGSVQIINQVSLLDVF